MLVIGPRDLEVGNVSVRIHGQGNLGANPRMEVRSQRRITGNNDDP